MRSTKWLKVGFAAAFVASSLLAPQFGLAQASSFRGLWVGSAVLNAVNEVSIPLDAGNVPVAPDPEIPTPSFDWAELRLLIHVNGAGQASLLKDVAVLNRVHGQGSAGLSVLAGENDLSLVTDSRLYPEFPPQPAMRYASAVFDFGDAKTTEALDTIVEFAAREASAFAADAALVLSSQGERVQARNDAILLIEPPLAVIMENADVAEAFNQFILQFNTAAMTDIINNGASDPVVAALRTGAEVVRDQSFYGDTRAMDMVNAVVSAVEAAAPDDRPRAAHHAASAFADVLNLHQRFISGGTFGDMISAAAVNAGVAARVAGATLADIEAAMRSIPESVAAIEASLQAKVPMYNDTRSGDAVNTVLAAMAGVAFLNAAQSADEIRLLSEQAGRAALADMVARYPLPSMTPTADYNAFVASDVFSGAPSLAAFAAVDAAIQERAVNPLFTPFSLYSAAKVAAVKSLQAAYRAAARAMRTELPMVGVFAPGSGDSRAVSSLAQPSDLGPAGLTVRIVLPASHPTNPFRHRRHPDHTVGYDIERVIRLDFDGLSGDSLEVAGYGVDRITGTYREEIFGLHKPLGPAPESNPVGLRTEGRFELKRVSLIDTLNTR